MTTRRQFLRGMAAVALFGTTVKAESTPLTEDDFRRMIDILDRNDVPQQDRTIVVDEVYLEAFGEAVWRLTGRV